MRSFFYFVSAEQVHVIQAATLVVKRLFVRLSSVPPTTHGRFHDRSSHSTVFTNSFPLTRMTVTTPAVLPPRIFIVTLHFHSPLRSVSFCSLSFSLVFRMRRSSL